MPPAEASAEAPTSEEPVGTVAVADEPATSPSLETEAPGSDALTAGAATSETPVTEAVALDEPVAEMTPSEAIAPEAAAPDAAAPDAEPEAAATEPEAAATEPEAPAVEAEMVAELDLAEAPAPDVEAEAPAAVEPEVVAPAPAAKPVPTGPEPTTMAELLAEQDSDIKSFKHGDVVEGSVVRIDKDEILVDIGAKSEGVVSNRELFGRNTEAQPALNVGDVVLVYVLQPESPEGHVVLSLRRAGLERKWRSMQEQFEAGVIIEAPVIDHNKGGLIVDCGIRGFVPISQIVDFPRRPQNDQPRDAAQEIAEKLQPFVGRKLRLEDPRGQPQGEPPDPVREGGAVRGAAREARRALQQPPGRPEGHRQRSLDRAVRRVRRPRRHRRPGPQERALVEQGQQPRGRLPRR